MRFNLLPTLPIFLALISGGCTLNEGDPQTTLCQKLTEHISLNPQLNWDSAVKTPQKDKSMKVEVHTSKDNSTTVTGVCIYLTDANDDGTDYDVNILDGYQNIPSHISVNGRQVPTKELHVTIQKVTGQSVKDTLKKL